MIFGDIPIRAEQIVEVLRAEVEDKANFYRLQHGIPEVAAWTTAVKATLAELAYKYGGRALFTDSGIPKQSTDALQPGLPPPPSVREFLLDFVWWESDGVSGRAVMGVECEWAAWCHNNRDRVNEVAYDFEKLLSFKAPLKLLIFECFDQDGRKLLHATVCDYLSRFSQHVKGECYIFVEFSRAKSNGHSYQCAAHIYRVEQDGAVSNVRLEPLA